MPPRRPGESTLPPDAAGFPRGVGYGEIEGALVNPRPYGAPAGQQAQPVPAVQVFPVWLYPPQGARQFNTSGSGTLAAGAGQTLTIASVSYTAPQNWESVIRTFSLFVAAPTASLNVTWTILVNNAPLSQGGGTYTPFPILATDLVQNADVVFRDIQPSAVLSVLITNNSAAGPWTVGAGLGGWSYDPGTKQRMYGGVLT